MASLDQLDQTGTPPFLCVGGIFIDDIVFPDGRTQMEILGGGGVHAAAGVHVWDKRVGLVALMGAGIPASALARLQRDFDLRGVIETPLPQIRAWHIFEWNGRRTEIFRVEDIGPFMDTPTPSQLPEVYRAPRGVHILRNAQEFFRWRQVFPDAVVLWEPEQMYMVPENQAEFRAMLLNTEIISPNLHEAALVYGEADPQRLVDAMLADGARVVALRMGELGSLVATQERRVQIPAVPVPQVIDQTGAGNTYGGAFLVGWCQTADVRLAGCYGAVAASFSLETIGLLTPPDAAARNGRYQWILNHTLSG